MKTFAAVPALLLLATPMFAAEESDAPDQACETAASLSREGDIEGALEEARWCVEALEQQLQARKSQNFRDEIEGWKRGRLEQQKAMGMSIIETTYKREDKAIKVNLTAGAGGSMGSLAALSQLGMAQGGMKVRIQRHTAMVTESGNKVEVMVGLKSGGMLNFSSRNAGKEEVIGFARAFPIRELDR